MAPVAMHQGARAIGRRSFLGKVVLAVAPMALIACERRSGVSAFKSLDVTGADWGRDFRLLDPEGRSVRLVDFRGRCVLLFFGFTQCPSVCPTALARAVDVMQRLGTQAAKLQVIFVTVDPERDTPAVLREYTRVFHPSFIGLHADKATTEETAKNFKVFYRKVPTGGSYTMDHTATSYVFDTTGRLRLAVRHEQDAASIASDIAHLLDAER